MTQDTRKPNAIKVTYTNRGGQRFNAELELFDPVVLDIIKGGNLSIYIEGSKVSACSPNYSWTFIGNPTRSIQVQLREAAYSFKASSSISYTKVEDRKDKAITPSDVSPLSSSPLSARDLSRVTP